MKLTKYIGMDVHKATTVIAVLDSAGKVLAEAIIETKGSTILDFLLSQRGTLHVALWKPQFSHNYLQKLRAWRPCGGDTGSSVLHSSPGGCTVAQVFGGCVPPSSREGEPPCSLPVACPIDRPLLTRSFRQFLRR